MVPETHHRSPASASQSDPLLAAMVEALYGTPSTIVYGMMIINIIFFTAFLLSGDYVILGLSLALAAVNVYRAFSQSAYDVRARGSEDRALNLVFERRACVGAWLTSLIVGVFGAYTVTVHPYQPAALLGVAQTMGYLAGIAGRNASRPRITVMQILLVAGPFMVGLALTFDPAHAMISAAVAFTLLTTLTSVGSIHEVFVSRFRTHRQLEALATRDPLTGLANRYHFMRVLGERQETDATIAVMSVDLDNFKLINDAFGHDAGDQVLIAAAERIAAHAPADALIARIGGDEFLLLFSETDPQRALQVADDIVSALCEPFLIGGVALRCGASAGVVVTAARAHDAILKEADLALYSAKDQGRNRACLFQPSMRIRYDERIALERDLRLALERGDITLLYQPIVSGRSRRIETAEALVRWEHATRGSISPAVFIPLAETTGLILTLGAWVVETACRTAADWPNDVAVSVNLSAKQFRADHDLVGIVKAALATSRLRPERLVLEITESALIDDYPLVVRTLKELRALGVKIALDDFGTGYSSLGYLSELPLDKLKIDRTFVASMGLSRRSARLLRGMTQIARDLDLDIIVEGIETREQLLALSDYPIDGIQGFLFSRPVSAKEVGHLIPRSFDAVFVDDRVNLLVTNQRPSAA